jgi:mRNA interferase MazF
MTKSLLMNLQRGDVVLCRMPMPSTQFQQLKIRPAVVVSTDQLNQILDDLMVVPCTSNTNRLLTATQYLITGEEITGARIRVESVVRCESIFTLNKTMIIRKLGSLSAEVINQVNVCLMEALEL